MSMPDIFPSTPSFKLCLEDIDSIKCSHAFYVFTNCSNSRILTFPSTAAYANELNYNYDDVYSSLEVGCLCRYRMFKMEGNLWLVKTKDGTIHPWIKMKGWKRFIWAGSRIELKK